MSTADGSVPATCAMTDLRRRRVRQLVAEANRNTHAGPGTRADNAARHARVASSAYIISAMSLSTLSLAEMSGHSAIEQGPVGNQVDALERAVLELLGVDADHDEAERDAVRRRLRRAGGFRRR